MKKALFLFDVLLVSCIIYSHAYTQDLWQPLNGPYGGIVNKLISAPNGTLYAITGSGIFKSTNDGATWSQSTPSSIKNLVTGVAAPNGYIYAATGNYTSIVYRSTDEGQTWQERLPDGGYEFYDMAATPGGAVFAGTHYMFSFHGQFIQSGEIYRSLDNGNTFTSVPFPDLAISSLKANINGDIYAATTEGLFKSANNGSSWSNIRSGSTGAVFTSPSGHIFCLTLSGVIRSTNHGSSWESTGSKMPSAANTQGDLFAVDGNIFKSTNNGSSWIPLPVISTLPLFSVNSVIVKGANNLFAGSDLGVHKSLNGGLNWTEANNGIRISDIRTVASKGNYIFTGSERYTSRSTDNGVTWSNLTGTGLPGIGASKILISSNGSVFAFTFGSNLYRSLNNGDTWSRLTTLPADANPGYLSVNNSELFVGSNDGKIYKSVNNGDTWSETGNGLPTDQPALTGLSVDPNTSHVYVSMTWGGFSMLNGLFKSTDNGSSWVQVSDIHAGASTFKFTAQGNIYALTGSSFGVSTNGGVSFETIPGVPEYVLAYDIGNQGQIFVAYVENEIYGIRKTSNNGQSWVDYTNGLGQLLVYDFAFDNSNFLLAGTQSGLFRTATPTGIAGNNPSLPSEFKLSQNYPNPFNPVTKIRFDLPSASFAKLSVFNTAGEEVAVLVNSRMNGGSHEVSWNASGFPSGAYFYKLSTGNFQEVKKMVLVK
jgi:photosystem II stability/assembly factor-like uncharacterized protein